MVMASPGDRASMAALYDSGSRLVVSEGKDVNETSRLLYTAEMFLWRCSPEEGKNEPAKAAVNYWDLHRYIRIAGNLVPDVPTILRFPTFPLLLRSKRVRPTTPIFLSEPDMPPPTKPVVYSPVPTWLLP